MTALAGSVATAIAVIARAILLGGGHLAKIVATSQKALEVIRGNLINGRGIGGYIREASKRMIDYESLRSNISHKGRSCYFIGGLAETWQDVTRAREASVVAEESAV